MLSKPELIVAADRDAYDRFLHWFGLDSLPEYRKAELYADHLKTVEAENERIIRGLEASNADA